MLDFNLCPQFTLCFTLPFQLKATSSSYQSDSFLHPTCIQLYLLSPYCVQHSENLGHYALICGTASVGCNTIIEHYLMMAANKKRHPTQQWQLVLAWSCVSLHVLKVISTKTHKKKCYTFNNTPTDILTCRQFSIYFTSF